MFHGARLAPEGRCARRTIPARKSGNQRRKTPTSLLFEVTFQPSPSITVCDHTVDAADARQSASPFTAVTDIRGPTSAIPRLRGPRGAISAIQNRDAVHGC